MSEIATIGLDIAKSSFAVHGFDVEGKTANCGDAVLYSIDPANARHLPR